MTTLPNFKTQPTQSFLIFNTKQNNQNIVVGSASLKKNKNQKKNNHTIQKKNPIHIPKIYIKKNQQRQNLIRSQKQFQINLVINNNIQQNHEKFNQKLGEQVDVSIFDQLQLNKNINCHSPQLNQEIQAKIDHQQFQCIKDIWKSIQKLKEKKYLSKYILQMKTILNKICKTTLKPKFQFIHQIQQSIKKNNYDHFSLFDHPAFQSSPYSPSFKKADIQSTQIIDQIKISPKKLFDDSNSNQTISLENSHQQKIQYKKIMYMLNSQQKSLESDTQLFSQKIRQQFIRTQTCRKYKKNYSKLRLFKTQSFELNKSDHTLF